MRGRGGAATLLAAALVVLTPPLAKVSFAQASRRALPSPARVLRPTAHPRVAMKATSAGDYNDELILKAKSFVDSQSGFYSPADPNMFAEDFVFRGPYIGPLNKPDYLSVMNTFGIHKALPDIKANAFGFGVDPEDPNRIWFLVRNTGTFTGEPGIGLPYGLNFPPNGAKLKGCTETFSMIFDEERKVRHLTVGYVADRFEGNTRGKGAAVGIFNVIGLPFPEPGPLLRSVQWFNTEILDSPVKTYSLKKDLPQWWKDEDMGANGYS